MNTKTICIVLSAFLMFSVIMENISAARDGGRGRGRHEGSHEGELHGLVESLPGSGLEGTWIVGGQKVVVTKDTIINQEHGRIAVGSQVEVKGPHAGDAINAQWIEIKRPRSK